MPSSAGTNVCLYRVVPTCLWSQWRQGDRGSIGVAAEAVKSHRLRITACRVSGAERQQQWQWADWADA